MSSAPPPKLSKSPNSEDLIARQSDVTLSNKDSAYAEYNGFFISVLSTSILGCFILWSLLPTYVFEDYFHFDYLPDKYWTVAIPAYSLMLMLYIYIALGAYNTEVKSLKLDDIRNFIDEFSVTPGTEKATVFESHQEMAKYIHRSPSGVCDLPITLVNEVLYGDDDEQYSNNTTINEID